MSKLTDAEVLLTPAEVAAYFRVDPKTVTRWAKAGKITAIKTLGGHRRYRASEVNELLEHGLQSPGPASSQKIGAEKGDNAAGETKPKAVR